MTHPSPLPLLFTPFLFDMSLPLSRAKDLKTCFRTLLSSLILSPLFSTYDYVAICYVSKFHLSLSLSFCKTKE